MGFHGLFWKISRRRSSVVLACSRPWLPCCSVHTSAYMVSYIRTQPTHLVHFLPLAPSHVGLCCCSVCVCERSREWINPAGFRHLVAAVNDGAFFYYYFFSQDINHFHLLLLLLLPLSKDLGPAKGLKLWLCVWSVNISPHLQADSCALSAR